MVTNPVWWHVLIGFAVSIGGGLLITPISNALWRDLGWDGKDAKIRPHAHHASMVGVVERVLYTAAWLAGKPEFVAVWLALKVAGQWSRWSGEVTLGQEKAAGRAVFNVFLLGNAFSIAYGLVGGLLIVSLSSDSPSLGIWAAGALVAGSLVFLVWAKHHETAA